MLLDTLCCISTSTSRAPQIAELASARQLLDDCGHLLRTLDDHWKQAAVHLPNGHPAKTKRDDDDVF